MSCNYGTVCLHCSSRDELTSLGFGVFLFVFAYFLAIAPAPYLEPGVDVITSSAAGVGDTFAVVAEAVNGAAASYAEAQLATLAGIGVGFAWVGGIVGSGVSQLTFHPEVFGTNLRTNMRTLVRVYSPQPIHQYKWSKQRRYWNGRFSELMRKTDDQVASAIDL